MKIRKGILTGVILAFSIGLVACGNDDKKAGDQKKGGKGELAEEQVATIAVPAEVASLDSGKANDKASHMVLNQVYEGIYRLDKNNQPVPAGATELAKKSDDGLEYTVKLREDAVWTDGEPVVADDYVYAWRRVVDPETASEYAYLYDSVKNGEAIINGDKKPEELGIEAIDDHELKITLEVATPYFDSLLAFPSFFPLPQKVVEKYGDDFASNSENAVYNGPFTLAELDGVGSDQEWKFLKNEDYWDKDEVKMTEITATVIKEASTGLNLFDAGEVDDTILSGELAQQSADNDAYVTDKDGRIIYIEMNLDGMDGEFKNLNLRKALSYAVDGDAVVNNILGDGSTVATGIVPTELAAHPETGKDFAEESGVHKEFDEEKAKEYFEKAKKELKKDTIKFDILTDDNDSAKKIAEYVQGAYKDTLGIETTVTVVTKPIRIDRTAEGDFDMVLTGWGADYNDQSSFLDLFKTGNVYNRGGYSNAEYDKLIDDAATVNANNPEARWEAHLEAEKILLDDDAAIIPVYQLAEAHLRNPKMKGMLSHTAGSPYDYKYIYMEK